MSSEVSPKEAGILLVVALVGLFLYVLYRGFPATLYFLAALFSAIVVSLRVPRQSLWSEPLRVVTWSAAFGFLILTLSVAWFGPIGTVVVGAEKARDLQGFELTLLGLYARVKLYGLVAWLAVPVALIVLVVVGRRTLQVRHVDGVLRVRTNAKKIVGALAIASSFSLLSQPSILGKFVANEETRVEMTFRHLREKEHKELLSGIVALANAKAIHALPSDQRILVAAVARQARNGSVPPGRPDYVWRVVAAAFPSAEAPRRPMSPPDFPETPFPRDRFRADPEQFVERMRVDEESAEAFVKDAEAKYQREEREAISQILASPLPTAKDLTIEVVEHLLHAFLEVAPSLLVEAGKQILDAVADVGIEKGTRPFIEKLAQAIQSRIGREFSADSPERRARDAFSKAAADSAAKHPMTHVNVDLATASAHLAMADRLTRDISVPDAGTTFPIADLTTPQLPSIGYESIDAILKRGQSPAPTSPQPAISKAQAERIFQASQELVAAEQALHNAGNALRWHEFASSEESPSDATAAKIAAINSARARLAELKVSSESQRAALQPKLAVAAPINTITHPPLPPLSRKDATVETGPRPRPRGR